MSTETTRQLPTASQEDEVFLNEHEMIETIYHGVQTDTSLLKVQAKMRELISRLRAEGKPTYMIMDISDVSTTLIEARRVGLKGLQDLDYDKIAIYGTNLFIKIITNFIIMAANKSDVVKHFNSRDEAIDWLKS